MEHGQRYARMIEFVDICKALWASVEPDALIWDRENRPVADPDKVHAIDSRRVLQGGRGLCPARPRRKAGPVLIQAGSSPTRHPAPRLISPT